MASGNSRVWWTWISRHGDGDADVTERIAYVWHDWTPSIIHDGWIAARSELQRLLRSDAIKAWGRVGGVLGKPTAIPFDAWPEGDRAIDYENDTIRLIDGTALYSVHVLAVDQKAASAQDRPAPGTSAGKNGCEERFAEDDRRFAREKKATTRTAFIERATEFGATGRSMGTAWAETMASQPEPVRALYTAPGRPRKK